MRQTWTVRMAPFACAAMMVACGGGDGQIEDRRAQAGISPEQTQMLTLTGCVQTGPATDSFVLQNVRSDAGPQQPSADPAASRAVVTEGSWVRLSNGGAFNIDQYVGQQVAVTGTLRDTGESPIGTGGAQGYETPSGDRSQQAATEKPHWERKAEEAGPIGQETMAAGRAPEMQIQSVNATGRPCDDQQMRRQ